MKTHWPKNITTWQDGRCGYMSIPFTWLLPMAQGIINQRDLFVDRWIVGGPAVQLMPNYLSGATVDDYEPGVLQRVNPLATRTTTGCPRRCGFCAIGQRQIDVDGFHELDSWPNLPILCDNNLLAASDGHFEVVLQLLRDKWDWCDFNQGLDARLLTAWHAEEIAKVKRPIVRLALDSDGDRDQWVHAVELLRSAGVAKRNIRSYVLCGFRGSPEDDWRRCEFAQNYVRFALPMWFHPLNAMSPNGVTADQAARGWNHEGRRQLMGWYYKHRGTKLID